MSRVTDDELNHAKAVIDRAYFGMVRDLAEEVLFEAFDDELTEEQVDESIDERTDSGLVYTHDQWLTLFASRSTSDAWEEMRDMGMSGNEDPVAPWAVLTFRRDVQEAVKDSPLMEGVREAEASRDANALINWLIENHGGQRYPLKDSVDMWLIGEVEGVRFGVLVVDEDETHRFIARSLTDKGSLNVLLDLVLENGGDYNAPVVRDFIRKAAS